MRRQNCSRERLIALLQEKAAELGRSPRIRDIKDDLRMPPYSMYYEEFSSWNDALEAAGLRLNLVYYSRGDFIRKLKEKSEELGGIPPRVVDVNNDNEMPSAATYRKIFGTWRDALNVAGLKRFGPTKKVTL